MNSLERKNEILRILANNRDVSMGALSKMLNVSTVTIRADLKAMENEGLVIRSHGKAVPTLHKEIMDRQQSFIEEKNRIAKAAANMVEDGDKIMIIAGTTSSLMAKYLLGKRDIHIVTNSTLLLPFARINPSMQLTTIGGEFIPSEEAYAGPLALQNLEQFHVDKAFIGTDGFSIQTGVTAKSMAVAEIGRKMVEHSRKRILLADSNKYGRHGFARIVPLNLIDTIITDKELEKDSCSELEKLGMQVCVV